MNLAPWLVAAVLFLAGLYGIVTSRHLIHLIGCLTVCQSATYLVLLSVGYRWGGLAPVFYDHPPGGRTVDPVVQALVLTDIVVGATISALLLAIAIRVSRTRGSLDPEALSPFGRDG